MSLLSAAWRNSVMAYAKGFRNVICTYPSTLLWPLFVFALICGVGVWGVTRGAQLSVESAKVHAESLAVDAALAYRQQLSVPFSITQVLASTVTANPDYDTLSRLFNATASALASAAPANSMKAFQLVPAGVIRMVYPLERNKALLGVDLFTMADPSFLGLLRHSATDPGLALDGPFATDEIGTQEPGDGALLVIRKSIQMPVTNPNETFGRPDSPNERCGDACGYNATSGTKFWGFAAALVQLDALGSPMGIRGQFSPLHNLAAQGYHYTLTAPVNYHAPDGSTEFLVAQSASGLPHDPVEATVELGNVDWVLRVGPARGSWTPKWLAGIVALVVVVAAVAAVLLFAILVSRRRHKILLESLLPRELIKDLQADNTDVLSQARVFKSDSPADLLVALLGCLLSGQPPDLRDVVLLRTVLQRGEDVYRPLDLGGRIRGANLDKDVARALMRQLGGAADMPGMTSYDCSQTGVERCPAPTTRSAAAVHSGRSGRSGAHEELSMLLSTPQQREQHLRLACQSLRGALDYILLGTGEQEEDEEGSIMQPLPQLPVSVSVPRVRRSVEFALADSSLLEAGSDVDGLGQEARAHAAPVWGPTGSERERGVEGTAADAGPAITMSLASGSQQRQPMGISPTRRGSGSGLTPRLAALAGVDPHSQPHSQQPPHQPQQHEGRSRRSSGVGLNGWRLGPLAVTGLEGGPPRLSLSVRCGTGLHLEHGGGGGSSRRPSYVRYGSPRSAAAITGGDAVVSPAAITLTEAPGQGQGAEGHGQGSPMRHSPRCGSPRSSSVHPSGRGSADRLYMVRGHPDPAQLSRAMLMGRRGKRSSGGGGSDPTVAAASGVASSEGAAAQGVVAEPPPPPRPVVEEVERLLQRCDEWQYDTWALHEASGGHALSVLGFFLIQRAGLVERFRMEPLRLARFLRTIEGGYLASNPYHNSVHAADVLRTLHVLVSGARLTAHYLDPLGLLAAYLAAIVHDHGHPGLTNDFLNATWHPLALRYNDRSPLESHHAASAFCLLAERPELDVLSALSRAERAALRKQIIEMVLATDMKQHFAVLSQFTTVHRLAGGKVAAAQSVSGAPSEAVHGSCKPTANEECGGDCGRSAAVDSDAAYGGPVPLDEAERLLSLQVALKVADLGHLGAKLETHKRWLGVLEEEFFRQGDLERQLGLPISPLFDRAKQGVSKSQVGFYEFVVLPLVHAMVSAFPGAAPLQRCFEANYQHWREVEGATSPSVPGTSGAAPPQSGHGAGKGPSAGGACHQPDAVAVIPLAVGRGVEQQREKEDRSVRGGSRKGRKSGEE